jgi:hypothetical protein
LIDLDHHLGRIGRNHQYVGMGLHEKTRFFLVRLPQTVAGFDGLGKASVQIFRLRNANTVRTLATEIRQAVRGDRGEAIHRLGHHHSQRVLAGTCGASQNHSLGKPVMRQHLAQPADRIRIAVKIGETHKSFTTEAQRNSSRSTNRGYYALPGEP